MYIYMYTHLVYNYVYVVYTYEYLFNVCTASLSPCTHACGPTCNMNHSHMWHDSFIYFWPDWLYTCMWVYVHRRTCHTGQLSWRVPQRISNRALLCCPRLWVLGLKRTRRRSIRVSQHGCRWNLFYINNIWYTICMHAYIEKTRRLRIRVL